jgi:hypothetical protein
MVAKALKLCDRERVRLLSRLDGLDLRCEPIEERKAELTKLLVSCRPALVVNRVSDAPGRDVFQHACKLGCEGIVSKRRGSRYVTASLALCISAIRNRLHRSHNRSPPPPGRWEAHWNSAPGGGPNAVM